MNMNSLLGSPNMGFIRERSCGVREALASTCKHEYKETGLHVRIK
jgi:hypothetical protein